MTIEDVLAAMERVDDEERAALAVRLAGRFREMPSGCLEWIEGRTSFGYGAFYWRGRSRRVPRMVWLLWHGEIPAGAHILHSCDNPPCAHPEHLRPGGHRENVADRERRNRHPRSHGANNGRAKLTPTDVIAIRQALAQGRSQKSLARHDLGHRQGHRLAHGHGGFCAWLTTLRHGSATPIG